MHIANDENIRLRAYQLWEHDGRPEGRALDHWMRALLEAGEPAAKIKKVRATRRRKDVAVAA